MDRDTNSYYLEYSIDKMMFLLLSCRRGTIGLVCIEAFVICFYYFAILNHA